MGGAMLRDFAIVATAFEVQATEAKKAGLIGVIALLLGTVLPFVAISTVRVRVEVLRKGRWVVVSTVSFLPPMGC